MAACLAAWPAVALTPRADREDAEYIELASRYPSSAALGANAGEAVLVAPRWLLTSAARAKALKPGAAITPWGGAHEIQSVHIHPAWHGGRENALALLLLREAVEGIEPTPPYRAQDEAGKTVAIVAHGADGRARAGINTIEGVTPTSFAMRIKPHDEASDLQAALAPADTGAPAFAEIGDDIFVAGIAVDLDDADRNGRTGDIGDREIFARVSAFADWIDATMFRAGADEAARMAPRKARQP
jgi:hypothetical protein